MMYVHKNTIESDKFLEHVETTIYKLPEVWCEMLLYVFWINLFKNAFFMTCMKKAPKNCFVIDTTPSIVYVYMELRDVILGGALCFEV